LSDEEEKNLYRLEKRLVANVNFDDQALNSLGFGTDIYHLVGRVITEGQQCKHGGVVQPCPHKIMWCPT
jgi:hypothetical protein